MTDEKTQQPIGVASGLNDELDTLKKENATLLARNNRLELWDIESARKAMRKLGLVFASDAHLRENWPTFVQRAISKIADAEQIKL